MADITMCSGTGCDLKLKCYRHTAVQSDWQSWSAQHHAELGTSGDCGWRRFWSIWI